MRARLFTLLMFITCASPAVADEPGFQSLFDGKTLQGWEGSLKTFRVEEGAIVGGTLQEPIARNEFLCTEKEYGDFELRLKFKVLGAGANAGVQIRSRRIPNHHEVKGYQADLGDGWWGSLYDESRRNKILLAADAAAVNRVLKRDDWNDYTIRCLGRRIQLWINGQQTVDYAEPDESIEQNGLIGLQIHGGKPSEAWYKDIRLKKL
jgi:3-keto-disaccharide hydrolase